MSPGMYIVGGVAVLVSLLIALGLFYYVRVSLRSGAAIGLGWDFEREQEPIRYWFQLGAVALIGLKFLVEALFAIAFLLIR